MNKPIMARATAVWLVDNTTLTFNQIAEFCGMHELEVQGIADGSQQIPFAVEYPAAQMAADFWLIRTRCQQTMRPVQPAVALVELGADVPKAGQARG